LFTAFFDRMHNYITIGSPLQAPQEQSQINLII